MRKLLAFLCLMMLLLSGCGKAPVETTEPEALEYTFRALLSGRELDLSGPVLISSITELAAAEAQWEVDLSVNLPNGDPYTEAFFRDSSLLLVQGSCSFIPQAFWVERVEKEQRRITVYAVQGEPTGGDDAFGHCLMGLELKKTDAEGCDFTVEFLKQPVILAY